MRSSGAGSIRYWGFSHAAIILLVLSLGLSSCGSFASALSPDQPLPNGVDLKIITVSVFDSRSNESLQGATVHVSASTQVDTDDDGGYYVQSCIDGQTISAWAPGYYIESVNCVAGQQSYQLWLGRTENADNLNYSWLGDLNSCAACHSRNGTNQDESLEWRDDGHSRVFVNPYFSDVYLGRDRSGNQSQQVQWEILDDGQRIYPSQVSPGYRPDYPVSNGNCALCHAPASHPGTLREMDVAGLVHSSSGTRVDAMTEGVTCDVCHKVTDVLVNRDNNMPYDDRPGILSMSIVRPMPGRQAFFGPLTHESVSTSDSLTCYPVFSESRFCASCHYARFANVEIYASYKEWLQSPYSQKFIRSGDGQVVGENPSYRSCQDCHMLSKEQVDGTLPSQRDACSNTNLNITDIDHNMMDREPAQGNERGIPHMVEEAAQIDLEARKEQGRVIVTVRVTNIAAGHKFPTDSPLRHLILLVKAEDWRENLLIQSDGPVIKEWEAYDHAGEPGQIFANVLKTKDTNLGPAYDYWNPVEPAWAGADTRLLPFQTVQSVYAFAEPYQGNAKVTATLIYRDVFASVASQKGWTPMNVVVDEDWIEVPE